jgi:hypothetical protein
VAIEKAFAIEAAPGEIWSALWQELQTAGEGTAELEQSHRPNLLAVKVKLGSISALLTYKITQREQDCEVAVTLEPLSSRYGLYQILTFGHLRKNYEMLLVQGLANLKTALEGEVDEAPGNSDESPQ